MLKFMLLCICIKSFFVTVETVALKELFKELHNYDVLKNEYILQSNLFTSRMSRPIA
jgi:hypothetical protein